MGIEMLDMTSRDLIMAGIGFVGGILVHVSFLDVRRGARSSSKNADGARLDRPLKRKDTWSEYIAVTPEKGMRVVTRWSVDRSNPPGPAQPYQRCAKTNLYFCSCGECIPLAVPSMPTAPSSGGASKRNTWGCSCPACRGPVREQTQARERGEPPE